MAVVFGDVNMPKEHYSDYSCDDIMKFLEEIIRSVFKVRNVGSEWTTQIDPGGSTWTLFMQEIGAEVVDYCNRYARECRKHDIFNFKIPDRFPEKFIPGYFYDCTSQLADRLLEKTDEQETANSTYYFLAVITELCFQLSISGRQNLIPSVIQGAEHGLHHGSNLEFQKRYWCIARHALNRYHP